MGYCFGIDIGGTTVKIGLAAEDGALLEGWEIPTRREPTPEGLLLDIRVSILDRLDRGLDGEKKQKIRRADILGIGMAAPGAVTADGILHGAVNIGWGDVALAEEAERILGISPVCVGNDARLAALGEAAYGAGVGARSMLMVTLGTGVGGGVVLDGKMLTGYTGAASELGHMVIRAGGEECTCGRRGCFEAYASATALIRETKRAMAAHPESRMHAAAEENGAVDGRTAFIAAQRGDAAAQAVVDRYLDDLACGVANIVNIFFPEVIALSGGVANQGDALLVPLRERVRALSYGSRYAVRHTRIELCTLGYRAGVIGAALLGRA